MPVPQTQVQETKYFDGQQIANTGAVNQAQQQFKGSAIGAQQFQQNQNNMIVSNSNLQTMNQIPSTPQMMPSPSGYAPSPSPMMPSPHNNLIRQTGSLGAPSPQSISLNTPGFRDKSLYSNSDF